MFEKKVLTISIYPVKILIFKKRKGGEKSKNESIFYKWRARVGESEQGSAYQ